MTDAPANLDAVLRSWSRLCDVLDDGRPAQPMPAEQVVRCRPVPRGLDGPKAWRQLLFDRWPHDLGRLWFEPPYLALLTSDANVELDEDGRLVLHSHPMTAVMNAKDTWPLEDALDWARTYHEVLLKRGGPETLWLHAAEAESLRDLGRDAAEDGVTDRTLHEVLSEELEFMERKDLAGVRSALAGAKQRLIYLPMLAVLTVVVLVVAGVLFAKNPPTIAAVLAFGITALVAVMSVFEGSADIKSRQESMLADAKRCFEVEQESETPYR